ncbi:hemicentin-2-like, partial [Ruditapes philippinarum]|uniref:hemicentin-2-like n=1 Tax=Ruditapes philippinarum TaxID=129788 RepID=UPI00295C326C
MIFSESDSPLVTIQGQQYTLNEGENKQFACTVDSKPISKITWYHEVSLISQETPTSGISRLSFTPINRTHYGSYSCKADNGIETEQQDQISITVKFKPLTTTITGNNNIIANGKTTLTLDCTSGSSNPISDITWTINNVITQATQNLSNQSGEYGGIKRRQRLILTPTRDNDGDIISCEAKNTLGTSNRNEETLDLRYRPLIKPMSDVIVVEGNNTELICAASSKPASTFKWYKQGQEDQILHQGTGTMENNKLSYPLTNVRRGDAATYTCNANNGIEKADSKNVLLTVYYPPDVSATTTNTTINAEKVIVTCNAHGVPDTSYTYGKWVQTWPGYDTPISEHSGSERLELTGLTYEHSGIYTCTASNGIRVFGTNQEYKEGSVHLVVKSYPIITNFSEITSSKLMENATNDVYYFSNVAGSNVTIYRNVNGSRQEDVKYSVTETNTQVNLKVFGHSIKTAGVRARLSIHVQTKDAIGSYDVVVSNEINSTVRSFEIVAKGPPTLPFNLTIDNVNFNEARLSWRRGYHGGFPQTFVIKLSTDQKSWKDVEVFDGKTESDEMISKRLSGLSPSTTYFVRMYSFNREGNSTATSSLNYTTSSKIETKGLNIGAIIGGAAGGSAALITILVFVLLMRRGTFAKCKAKGHDGKSDRKPVYEDEEDDDDYGMRENPMYVPAGPQDQSAGGNGQNGTEVEYSTVNKQKTTVIVNQNDVYAEVDKSKKMKTNNGKKEKEKKGLVKDKKGKKTAQEGDLYENATELMDSKKGRNDEIIYENPEPAKQTAKKNVNKDGLIYADLTFNDQPKGQKKLVIHGLDDMTEYVQVDFTKKAEPL